MQRPRYLWRAAHDPLESGVATEYPKRECKSNSIKPDRSQRGLGYDGINYVDQRLEKLK